MSSFCRYMSMFFLALLYLSPFHQYAYANTNDYTVDGDMTRFSTGDAFPKQVIFTGYNARSDEAYLSIEFEGGSSYDYEANIYQGSTGDLWGSIVKTGITDLVSPGIEEKNVVITASTNGTDLEVGNRIVVTVTAFAP